MRSVTNLDHLAPAIASGEHEAFAVWMSSAEPILRGSLRSFAAVVDTESVVQESLLRIWHIAARRSQPDGRPNALLRVALKIARNLAIDEARRRKREEPLLSGDPRLPEGFDIGGDPPDLDPQPLPDPLLARTIRACVEKLARRPRIVFTAWLAGAGALPDRDIASGLRMSYDAFRQNLSRARGFLRECLLASGITI